MDSSLLGFKRLLSSSTEGAPGCPSQVPRGHKAFQQLLSEMFLPPRFPIPYLTWGSFEPQKEVRRREGRCTAGDITGHVSGTGMA